MPYVVYHGDILKVDRARVRGMLYHTDKTELDVSLNGSVPVKNDGARQGMPDLDPTIGNRAIANYLAVPVRIGSNAS